MTLVVPHRGPNLYLRLPPEDLLNGNLLPKLTEKGTGQSIKFMMAKETGRTWVGVIPCWLVC